MTSALHRFAEPGELHDLGKPVEALHLGRKARRVSTQYVVFALLVLTLLIPLAVTGLVSVAFAVVAHEGSELLAVANGLRVGRVTPASGRAPTPPVQS